MLESGERQSLAQAVDGIQEHFGTSDYRDRLAVPAMAVVGVIGGFPMGILADRMRRTTLLAGAMVIWTGAWDSTPRRDLHAAVRVPHGRRCGGGHQPGRRVAARRLLPGTGAGEADGPVPSRRARRRDSSASSAAGSPSSTAAGAGRSPCGSRSASQVAARCSPAGAAARRPGRRPRRRRWRRRHRSRARAGRSRSSLDCCPSHRAHRSDRPLPRRRRARDASRELLQIRSMWFGVLALTVSQLLLNGLQAWGIQYYKEVHGLDEAAAGGSRRCSGRVGLRHPRRRLSSPTGSYVAGSSTAASTSSRSAPSRPRRCLMPAFASTNLTLTAPLMFVGGGCSRSPSRPAEALMSDVVVPALRGRAGDGALSRAGHLAGSARCSSACSQMRSACAPRLVAFCPVYAIGGIVMLAAAKHYPATSRTSLAQARRPRHQPRKPDTRIVAKQRRTQASNTAHGFVRGGPGR